MKHLKLFFALFAMLALGVGNAWAETVYFEGFEENHRTSGNNSYAATANTYGDWTLTYADAVTSGSPLTGTAHVIMRVAKKTINSPSLVSKALLSDNVSVTKVSWNCKGNTAQTLKVSYSTDGSNWVEKYSAKLTTSKANKSFTLDNVPGPIYLKFVVSVASSTNSNRDANIDDITIEGTALSTEETALSSITISGDLTDKTYEEGEELDLAGLTVTAKYDDNSEEDVTEDVEWSYTPNPLTKGTTSATVIATYEDKTATTTITGLTVNEHIIIPGEYGLLLNNVFFGTTAGTNVSSFPTSAKQDDITVTLNGSGTKTRTDAANVRMYSGNTLTFSVPVGYLITSIAFTEPSSSTQWDGKITVNSGDYDETNKSWSGLAQDVVFTFAAQNRIAKAIVTYIADVKSTLTIETPQNGTISVKNGTTEVTSGTQLSAGTSLVVTPTPNPGYVFESLTVGGEAVELTEGSYTFNMPAADVTISATFKANEKPAATLTLSKNGETEDITGYKQDDKVTLPSITSDCVKAFVGWSADANCTTEPEYKAGDEYTLASTTQILYAVYAKVNGGGESTAFVDMATYATANNWGSTSSTNQKQITINSDVKAVISEGGNSGKYYTDGVRIYQSESATVIISTTIGELKSVIFTFTNSNNGTLLYNGTALTSAKAVEVSGTSATLSVGNSGSATNGQIRISKIEVVYTGGVSYSNYSTTCVAALEKPTFSVAEGTYTEAKSIVLNATEGDIYYTLDGTDPTASSTQYTTAIVLDECGTTTIKAIAISTESQSPVASATYTINLPITNTAATAYTPTEAIAIIDGACDKTEEVFVKGVVVSTSAFNATYGNYDVIVKAVDDNSATPTTFTFYRMYKAADKIGFTASDEVIGVGDVITAKGKLKNHNSTYELAEGCYMVERVAFTEPKTDISNTLETAYTVDKAFELISDVKSDLNKEVYVKGLVAVASTQLYEEKYLTYSISDNGQTTGNVLKVYDGLDIDGVAFTSKDDVKVGDYVVVKGKLLNYGGTYEINKDNQLVQHKKAATITIADITMEVGETKTIAPTITPAAAETAVVYTIKENTDNAISLTGNTITANAVGTATITATIATAAEYMGKTVDFTVTVNAKSITDEVVILAELNGKWYAMKGAVPSGKSNQLDAIEVTYFNGTLYNVPDEVKASITWTRSVVDGKATFANNGKYLKGDTDTDLTLSASVVDQCKWMWDDENGYYTTNTSGTIRTFLYRNGYNFKNYGVSQAGKEDANGDYSSLPVVTAPVYATGLIIGEGVNMLTDGETKDVVISRSFTADALYTISLPFALDALQVEAIFGTGTTLYQFSGLEQADKELVMQFSNVTAIAAATPYLIKPAQNVDPGTLVEDVTIEIDPVNIEFTAGATTVTMKPILSATEEQTNGDTQYWLATDNYLYNNETQLLSLRALFEMTTVSGMPPRCRAEFSENEETALDNISTTDAPIKVIENGQLIIIRDGEMYNAMGVKL